MRENVQSMLSQFAPGDVSVRFCQAIFSAVPFAPAYVHYAGFEDAVRAVVPGAGSKHVSRAAALGGSEELEHALFLADSLDTGDKGIAITTGLKSAFQLFFAAEPRAKGLEADPQQAGDAALKALGLASLVDQLLPGPPEEKVHFFKQLPSGQALTLYFATLEVAVPFTDAVLAGGGRLVADLMARSGPEAEKRLAPIAGAPAVERAKAVLALLQPPMEGLLLKAVQYVRPLVEKVQSVVPGIVPGTERVAGAVASGADILPMWRLLGARLCAEAAALRAQHELDGKPALPADVAAAIAAREAAAAGPLPATPTATPTATPGTPAAGYGPQASATPATDTEAGAPPPFPEPEARSPEPASPTPTVPAAPSLAEVHFSPGDACVQRIASLLKAARETADVCVFTITDDRVSEAILEAYRRGVTVRIVTDDAKAYDEGSDVDRLARAGVNVRVDRSPFHMHHKFALFDRRTLLTGSYNWTRGAAINNEENLIVTDDPRFAGPFLAEFERLWAKFAPGA